MEASGRELFSLCASLKVDEPFRPEFRLGQEEGEGVAPREPGWGVWRYRRNRAGMQSCVSSLLTPLLLLQGWASSGKSLSRQPRGRKACGWSGLGWQQLQSEGKTVSQRRFSPHPRLCSGKALFSLALGCREPGTTAHGFPAMSASLAWGGSLKTVHHSTQQLLATGPTPRHMWVTAGGGAPFHACGGSSAEMALSASRTFPSRLCPGFLQHCYKSQQLCSLALTVSSFPRISSFQNSVEQAVRGVTHWPVEDYKTP